MKKILKIVLTVAFVAGSTSVFAQKLGRINMQELVFAMPETAEMQKNLEAYQKELQDQLETIGVEFNNKLNEYTKQVSDKNSTMSDSVRQLKEKELNDLKTRYDEFVQVSQQDMQKKQGELLEPIIVKAQDAQDHGAFGEVQFPFVAGFHDGLLDRVARAASEQVANPIPQTFVRTSVQAYLLR